MIINNSRLKTYNDCPRKYYWMYVFLGGIVRRAYNKNFVFGRMVHYLLALYYGDQRWNEYMEASLRDSVPDYDQLPGEEQAFWSDLAEWAGRMMKEYVKWAAKVDKFTVIDIEAENTVLLGTCCTACGATLPREASPEQTSCTACGATIFHLAHKLDLVVNQDGAIVPLDHKTTSGIGDAYLESWQYSPQMYLYLLGTQKNWPQADRFQMNFLRKAKTVGLTKLRACPACKNGSQKRLSCESCRTEGKIEVPACDPPPFHREPATKARPDVMDRVVASRLNTCIQIDTELTQPIDPLESWKMKPESCFDKGRCSYIDLCWSKGPIDQWHHPSEELLDGYISRPKDYVTLAEEEQV